MTAIVIDRQGRLRELEEQIHTGFMRTGLALLEIKTERLWEEDYESFEAYCRDRWGFGRVYAWRLMDASKSMEGLTPVGCQFGNGEVVELLPSHESQARALAEVEDIEDRQQVWEQSVKLAGGKQPTAKQIGEVADLLGDLDEEIEEVEKDRYLSLSEEVARKAGDNTQGSRNEESLSSRLERGIERIRQAHKLFAGAPVSDEQRAGVATVLSLLRQAERAAEDL